MTPTQHPDTTAALSLIRAYADPVQLKAWAADLRANADNQGYGSYVSTKPGTDEQCWCALGRLKAFTGVRVCDNDADWLRLLGAIELPDPPSPDVIFWGIAKLNDGDQAAGRPPASFNEIADLLEGDHTNE